MRLSTPVINNTRVVLVLQLLTCCPLMHASQAYCSCQLNIHLVLRAVVTYCIDFYCKISVEVYNSQSAL